MTTKLTPAQTEMLNRLNAATVKWSLETIATLAPWFVVVPKPGGWSIEWDNGLNFYANDRVLDWRGLTEFAECVRDEHEAGLL